LDNKNQELSHKEDVRNATIRDFYKKGEVNTLEMLFNIDSSGVLSAAQSLAYYKKFIDESVKTISSINSEIAQYEADKKEAERLEASLEQKQKELLVLKQKLDEQVKAAQSDLSNKQEERQNLQQKLEELSAKQRALLAEKTGTFSTTVGLVPLSDDPASSPNYDPGFSPAFALFSFGAPHRKGLSQYGAYGRAKEGQDYEEILKAYYGDIEVKKVDDIPDEINTDQGTLNFEEDYLMGIAEMPPSWSDNDLAALKAQAVAARTYALAYTGWRVGGGGGGTICTSESCQVYRSDRVGNPAAENWHRAVEETKGEVVVSNETGDIFSTWYASTAGGFTYSYTSFGHTTSGGWDTRCNTEECWLKGDAYEVIAGSPWFYKAWYKKRGGDSCGRDHPWLNEEEFSDIINALIIFTHNSDEQSHLSQVDAKSCWGKDIEDTWDYDEVKKESEKYDGGGVSEIKSVGVDYSSGGYTDSVTVKTDKRTLTFSGDTFRYVFNLRAPGAIWLPSALFNVEKK